MNRINKKILSIILLIFIIGILTFICLNRENIIKTARKILKLETKEITYEVCSNQNGKIKLTLTATDTENGVEELELPDGDKIISKSLRYQIATDYIIESDGTYTFTSKSTTGETMTETIEVNEEFRNNLIGIEKIQEISTEQDYKITKKYDGKSNYKYYYAIGENNDNWIELPNYQIVNVDEYKIKENNWTNAEGKIILKVKKVSESGKNEVEIHKIIEDLSIPEDLYTEEEQILEGESIIACVRDNDIKSGNYRLKVNGEEYPAEIYNYDENVNYITEKNLGTSEEDSRMLILKYNGNLNIDSERLITAQTRKKGMFIYVAGELTNNGEISMTARGAKAEGQDVYLWRHENGAYEYVPAVGTDGGESVTCLAGSNGQTHVTYGMPGKNGELRRTGGGGSGLASGEGGVQTGSCISKSGAGAKGTSYSGGTGGGRGTVYYGDIYNGKDGEINGGAGGIGYHLNGVNFGDGAGNPSGGTGGLLIIYTNTLQNNNMITSKGSDAAGGASGGGSVNVFYNQLVNEGTIEASGGTGTNGGNGGDGSIFIQDINIKSPTIEVTEITRTSFKVNIEDNNTNLNEITYDYYINGDKKIEDTNSKEEIFNDLTPNTEYNVMVNLKYKNVKICSNIKTVTTNEGETIYVSVNGNDSSGDGKYEKPYASLAKAITMASNGNSIYVMAGEYNLEPMTSNTEYAQAGIYDQGKKLIIYGDNEKTILKYNGKNSALRDGPALTLANSNTIVRNLTYEYEPKLYIWVGDQNIGGAIFDWCFGTVENVFFRIVGENKAIYLYNNNQDDISKPANNVLNCTFFHDLNSVGANYSGRCNFTNIATNVNTNGTNTNVIVKSFGNAQDSIQNLIEKSKNDSEFNSEQVGVFYGEHAWSK